MLRFLVFSDLHYDEVADGDRRVDDIVASAQKRNLDFIVSLGDLCKPVDANKRILDKFASLGVPFYNVIGNHETDDCRLADILKFFSIKSPYYSVASGGYKLIFLNTCYLNKDGQEEAYYQLNFRHSPCIYPIVPLEEIKWLENELRDGMKCIIFSHHSLVNDFGKRGVYNRENIRKLFKGKPVLLCMNGHDHGDSCACVDGVPYYTVNSANYAWCGTQIASSEALKQKYSYLHGMLQYKQAMSVYVEIDGDEIRINGMESEYLSVTPDDIGLHDYMWNGVSIKPRTSSYILRPDCGSAQDCKMEIKLYELTHENLKAVSKIDRSDISEAFVDTVSTIMEITDYGVSHHCIGHTFAVKYGDTYIGLLLLGEAIEWETDPPEMKNEPFYRLMGFVIDKKYRGKGIGGKVLEMAITKVYEDFGERPIALGCHKDNHLAAKFYIKHGFKKTEYMEGSDIYYLRYPKR